MERFEEQIMYRKNFMGMEGFVWFMGVVENRKDPLKLGRCQVRCFGWHSDSKTLVPSADLPWAQPLLPVNGGSQTGTPKEGDYVIGFFTDGESGQFPIIMGILPGIPDKPPVMNKGFYDQRDQTQLEKAPRTPNNIVFKNNGDGATINEQPAAALNPHFLNEPTTTRLYRNENVANTVIGIKRTTLDKGVPTGSGETWDEPYPAYNTMPPYNHVIETESGHAFELDDTPGDERIHLMHRSGTFQEFYPSGTKVEKVVKNNYQIIMGDDMIHVMGRVNITVDSDVNILARGDVNVIGGNDLNARIAGNINVSAGENLNFRAANITMETEGTIDILAGTIRESSTSKNVTTDVLSENSGTKNMTASTYLETVGESSYRWNGNKHMWTGANTYERHNGGTDYTNPGDPSRSGSTSGASVSSATSAEEAVSPDIPLAPYRSKKNNSPFEEEPVPIPNLDVVDIKDVDATQGYALSKSQNGESPPPATPPLAVPNDKAACIPIANLNVSQACIDNIKTFEGFSAKAYPDPGTKAEPITIGYGMTAVAIGRPIVLGDTITKEQAESDLLMLVSKKFVPSVKKMITCPCVTQGQFDAMVSFAYNVGVGNLKKSDVLSLTNIGDKPGAANAFLNWNKAAGKVLAGLTKRREAEKALYLS